MKTLLGLIAAMLALIAVGGGIGLYVWLSDRADRRRAGGESVEKMKESNRRKQAEIDAMDKQLADAGERPPERLEEWPGRLLTLEGCVFDEWTPRATVVRWKGVRVHCDPDRTWQEAFRKLDSKNTLTVRGRCDTVMKGEAFLSECLPLNVRP